MDVLALKLFLVPSLLLLVSLIAKKWGPQVAGWASAFPVISGPILLLLFLEHGNAFAATAATGTLTAVLAILSFSLTYAWASARFQVFGAMSCAITLYALAVAALQCLQLTVFWRLVCVLLALAIAPRLFPPIAQLGTPTKAPQHLIWRMLAGLVLVLFVTYFAQRFGPKLSGFLAMFPVMGSVLTGLSHHFNGRDYAVSLLRGTVFGFYAFALFCFTLATLLPNCSGVFAFAAAFICALVVQITTRLLLTAQVPQASAKPS
jgi:hypothetical protein